MKFKEYFNSLVSKRKTSTPSSSSSLSKSQHQKPIHPKTQPDSTISTDCHYDICGYDDMNGVGSDDQHSRTEMLLARHAQLVNTIVGTRSSHENISPSCTQCRTSRQSSSMISPLSPPPPTSMLPPLPPKLSMDHQMSFSNRNYSSTLATCSPRRECQQQQQQQTCHPTHLISTQYSTPNSNVISSSSNSLWTTTTGSLSNKQRSRIRTNPWIGSTPTNHRASIFAEPSHTHPYQTSPTALSSQPEYGVYDPTYRKSPFGLIHSESFPQTTSNGNIHLLNSPPPPPTTVPAPPSSVILHQSDSGHGFSLSSSRVIGSSSLSSSSPSSSSPSSSSSPDNTSSDGILLNDKQHYRQKKLKKKFSSTSSPSSSSKKKIPAVQQVCSNTISSDSGSLTRRKKTKQVSSPVTLQYRYQRPPNPVKISSPMDRIHPAHHSQSSSSRSIDDHFSIEFEEALENERSSKPRKEKQSSTRLSISPRKSPFILPLDDTNMKLSSPPPLIFSPTLTKTNSRAILKHIEEIENEIRLIKNLDLANHDDDDEEYVLSPHAYPEDDIDLDDEIDDIKGTEEKVKDNRESIYEQVDRWVEKCLNASNTSGARLHTECDQLSDTIKDYVVCVPSDNHPPPTSTEIMTAFYLSSTPKRTSSFVGQPLKFENIQNESSRLKPIHECPF